MLFFASSLSELIIYESEDPLISSENSFFSLGYSIISPINNASLMLIVLMELINALDFCFVIVIFTSTSTTSSLSLSELIVLQT